VCRSVLQCVAACCSVLQCVAVRHQNRATVSYIRKSRKQNVCYRVLQCVAAFYSVSQCVAVRRIVLQ